MQVLATTRLALRQLTLDDAPFILRLVNEPGFLRYIGDKGVRDLAGAERYLRTGPLASYAQHGFGLWLVSLRADATPVGLCGLLRRPVLDDVDIGFAFLAECNGRGYATEAAAAVLHHSRTTLGLPRIVAITAPDNAASARVLEKIGLRFDRLLDLPGYPGGSRLFVPAEP
jgi:RimJ/RimL family protein N-acetyltransferase